MIISIIANGFQPDYIVNLVNGLSNHVTQVDLIGSDIYDHSVINSRVRFLNLRASHEEGASQFEKAKRIILYYVRLFKYALTVKSFVFHVQWLRFYFFDGVIVCWILRLLGKKVVYTAHDPFPHMKDTVINRFKFFLIYCSVNTIIVHTEFIKTQIVTKFKISSDKVFIVKHGVYQVRENLLINKNAARKNIGITADEQVLLFFGNITSYKGLDLLFEAFQMVKSYYPKLKLLVAGRVREDYEKQFNGLVAQLRSEELILKLGYIPTADVELVFKAADIIVLPYREASQSGVLFMSYCFGRPVIAPDFGNFPQDVLDNETGYIFKKCNAASLAQKIRCFLDGPLFNSADLECAIKRFASAEYSWEKIGFDLQKVYSK